MDPLNPQVIVGEPVAGKSAALRKRIMALAQDLNKNTFDIAEAFFQAQESHCYIEWGYEALGEYAALELGIKHRKAQYLARIVRVCRECGIARKDYEPVGVTKLREITSLDPQGTFFNTETKQHESLTDHIVRLVAEAPENSSIEVEEEVKRLKGQLGENAMVTKSYSVTKSCYENTIQRCFEAVRRRLGSAGRDGTGAAKEYTDGNVIECLCAEYNADPRNFYEEEDESAVQIEAPSEDANVNVARDSCGTGGTPVSVDSEEDPQDTLRSRQSLYVVPTE
jgi:hypothetical protein